MGFSEYDFDVTRLWDEPRGEVSGRAPVTRTSTVVFFPAKPKTVARVGRTKCLAETKAELVEIAMSLKFRDTLRRNGLADRCAACARCPEMTG